MSASHHPVRRLIGLISSVLLLLGLGCLHPALAQADEMAEAFIVNGQVSSDGSLHIQSTLTFTTSAPESISQRFALTKPGLNYTELRYQISNLEVTSKKQPVPNTQKVDHGYLVVDIDTHKLANEPLDISYTVKGAAVADQPVPGKPATTTVSWRLLQGLSVPVRQVTGKITLPDGVNTLDIDCESGPPVATTSCQNFASGTFESLSPSFTDGPRGVGEVVELSFRVESSAVAPNQSVIQRWTLDRAFSVGWPQLLVTFGLLLIGCGALFLLWRKLGSDIASATPTRVAEFVPIAAGEEEFSLQIPIRPGEVGTLLDERVDPVDIAATLLDLAQRGHLQIEELPRTKEHAMPDWVFHKQTSDDELTSYEKIILDVLTPADRELKLSDLPDKLPSQIEQIQNGIYQDVVENGWFLARPDKVRKLWGAISWGLLAAAVVSFILLIAFTRYAICGIALLAMAVGFLWLAQQMPRRTAAGSSVLAGLRLLSIELQNQNTGNVPKADAYAQISKILPYTVVLGGTQRWLQALADADDDPGVPDPDDLSWYKAPQTWHLRDLPSSLETFLTIMQGKLFAR